MSTDWKQPCWNVIAEPGGPFACLLTWCCPCVTYGINLRKLEGDKEAQCAGDFTSACCLYCLVSTVGCMCVVHIPTRKHLRKKYGIKEPQSGILEDLFMTWCCSCCALIQDYNEITAHEGASTGASGHRAILTDLSKATDAATADVKKHAAAAKEGVVKAVEKKDDDKSHADEKKDANEEEKKAGDKKQGEAEEKDEKKEEEEKKE